MRIFFVVLPLPSALIFLSGSVEQQVTKLIFSFIYYFNPGELQISSLLEMRP